MKKKRNVSILIIAALFVITMTAGFLYFGGSTANNLDDACVEITIMENLNENDNAETASAEAYFLLNAEVSYDDNESVGLLYDVCCQSIRGLYDECTHEGIVFDGGIVYFHVELTHEEILQAVSRIMEVAGAGIHNHDHDNFTEEINSWYCYLCDTWGSRTSEYMGRTTHPMFCNEVDEWRTVRRCPNPRCLYMTIENIFFIGTHHQWVTNGAPPCHQRCSNCSVAPRRIACSSWGATFSLHGVCHQQCNSCGNLRSVACTWVMTPNGLECAICGMSISRLAEIYGEEEALRIEAEVAEAVLAWRSEVLNEIMNNIDSYMEKSNLLLQEFGIWW